NHILVLDMHSHTPAPVQLPQTPAPLQPHRHGRPDARIPSANMEVSSPSKPEASSNGCAWPVDASSREFVRLARSNQNCARMPGMRACPAQTRPRAGPGVRQHRHEPGPEFLLLQSRCLLFSPFTVDPRHIEVPQYLK